MQIIIIITGVSPPIQYLEFKFITNDPKNDPLQFESTT